MVAMSGGVDSSVAAALLAEAGHDVNGVTLRLWGGKSDSGCCSAGDVEDARRVAAQLGVPHYVFDEADEFEARVVAPYVDAYDCGATPNPCVACNRELKFGRLLDRARALGFDALATGHHARIRRSDDGTVRLARARDAAKDQSYVLVGLTQRELRHLAFPVGALTKAEVRARAGAAGLRTAEKPESMDVCFVTRRERVAFVEARTGARPGVIVDADGRELGRHDGIARFTVGQRRGLGVAVGERQYVVDVDSRTHVVTVGPPEALLCEEVALRDLAFVARPPTPGRVLAVQVRAHGTPVPGFLEGDRVRFVAPEPRVAPGQIVALYEADELVGGGTAR
ncbi:MAG: tRNA 2-thiouridine(34) synthase MnmA [Actinomycetota bacterium]